MSRLRTFSLAAFSMLLFFTAPAFAQFEATIQGTVTDPSGAIVPGATVTATNQATGIATTAQTTGSGVYRISGLPPGSYTVKVTAPSFKEHSDTNVRVLAETPRGLNVQLVPGATTETVTVTAENAAGLQTENANVAGTIAAEQVKSLPSFGRDPFELLRLAPGVFGDAARDSTGKASFLPNVTGVGGSSNSIYQVENQAQVIANGQRVTENNYMIDGVDVNSLTNGGSSVVTPNEESISEIKVLSSTYAAEDGRNSGAQIKVISKTGTNSLHGSGFFKYDEPGLNAFNDFAGFQGDFTKTAPPVRVDNAVRNFGGSVGGPIKKDKLFFFFSFEGEHRFTQNFGTNYIETPQFIQEVTAANPNSIAAQILNSPGTAPRVQALLTPSCADIIGPCQVVNGGLDLGSPFPAGTGPGDPYLPLNNNVGGASLGGGFDGIPDITLAQLRYPSPGTGYQYNGRVDWNLSSRHTIAASTYLTNSTSTSPPGTNQTSAANRDVITKPFSPAGTILWNWIVSPTMLNELRLNFSRFAINEVDSNPNANFGIPDVEIQDILKNGRRIWFGIPQGENTPALLNQNTYGLGDNFSKTLSRHNLKFGFEYRKEQSNNNEIGFARPLFTFSHLWNFANDAPIFEQNAINPVNGNPDPALRHFRTSYYGGFAQDDFKLTPNLTVNVGLRYEYFTPVSETNGLLSNLVLAGSGPDAIANASLITGDTVYSTPKNNFAPRFGFAWSPDMYQRKVVFRGGFGMYYDPIPEATFDPARENPPFHALEDTCCGTSTLDFSKPFDGGLILYSLGASNSPLSYPGNPLLGGGIGPNNFPVNGSSAQVYFTPRNVRLPYVYGYSFETEIQLPAQVIFTIGYQGSDGHHLVRIFDANQVFDAPAGAMVQANPAFFIKPDVTSNYNSMNVRVERRFANSFQAALKYRWSKSLDEVSFGQPDASVNETFPRDLRTEYGPSDFDTTNFFVASGVYDLPMFRTQHDLLGKILGGWELSGIFTWHSGFPWTPVQNGCLATPGQQFICTIRPIGFSGGAGNDTSNNVFLSPGGNFSNLGSDFGFTLAPSNCLVSACPPGVGRNSFRGPQYHSLDMTFGKNTPLPFLSERAVLQLRLNAFNVTNHLNLAPFSFNSDSTIIQSQFFGTAGTTPALAGRVLELQARFDF